VLRRVMEVVKEKHATTTISGAGGRGGDAVGDLPLRVAGGG
jgi:hypothetical protein